MVSRLTTVLHLIGWALAAMIAHAALAELDTRVPLAAHDHVVALEWNAEESCEELNAALDDFAEETGIVFGKLVPGQDQDVARDDIHLFGDSTSVTAGLPGAPVDGYSTDVSLTYRSSDELGLTPPVGSYYVYGTDDDAQRVAAFLAGHGFTVAAVVDDDDALGRIDNVAADITAAARLILLVMVVAAGGAALLRRRAHSVAFLQGLSWWHQSVAHVRELVPRWALTAAVMLPLAFGWSAFYNGGRGWPLYLGATASVATLFLIVDVLVTTGVVALLSRLAIPRALGGALPVRTVVAASYLVMIVAGLSLVSAVATGSDLAADLTARDEAVESYADAGDAVNLSLATANAEDEEQSYARLTDWLSEADARGEVLLTSVDSLQASDADLAFQPVLYVNDRYLGSQPIRLMDGGVFTPDPDRATVLIPDSLWTDRDRIMSAIQWDFVLADGEERRHDPEPVRVTDGDRFTYSSSNTALDPDRELAADSSFVTDPIVVSLPSTDNPIASVMWTNAASGGVIFPDPTVVERALREHPELNDIVYYTAPVAGEAKSLQAKAQHHFEAALMAAALSAAALLACALLITFVYTNVTAQWIFAHHIHGRRFVRVHRWFLVANGIVLAAVIGWIPVRVWLDNADYRDFKSMGAPPPHPARTVDAPELVAMVGVAVLVTAVVLTATAVNHRRIVRQGAAES